MARVKLPVIVGFGGINGAGRASGHHALARLVYDRLSEAKRQTTLASLATLMDLDTHNGKEQFILDHTLVRRIEHQHFNVDAVRWNQRFPVSGQNTTTTFEVRIQDLPTRVPSNWQVQETSVTHAQVTITDEQPFLLPTEREFEVKVAGQLPTGFEPGTLYPSRSHPRGLQMTVFAASDALGSLGIEWDTVLQHVADDQVSVYAGSAMGQQDPAGGGGMLASRANGHRVTSKYCPLSLAEMPADFINAYVSGTKGSTGATIGACASFLYNLRLGIDDIRSGRSRVAIVGGAEAPIVPEVMDGYSAMGALASDKLLRKLDNLGEDQQPDYRRACRPFAENCGFTIAESAQMVVLFDDELAMQLGATVYGAASDVFVNADGFKKSISGPGVGNYLTVAKTVAAARAIIGDKAVREGGMVQAHGTGTPQNRTTESQILNQVAGAFGIKNWPVAAIKCFLGHSLGSSSGDQFSATLGIWEHGLIPGITTIDEVADDVKRDNLVFSNSHTEVDPEALHYAVINAKGFGGNNASGLMLSPAVTTRMLKARYSESEWQQWQRCNDTVKERQRDYDQAMTAGSESPVYKFDHSVLDDSHVTMDAKQVTIGGRSVSLDLHSPYDDIQL